jgi:hypothetical protein
MKGSVVTAKMAGIESRAYRRDEPPEKTVDR